MKQRLIALLVIVLCLTAVAVANAAKPSSGPSTITLATSGSLTVGSTVTFNTTVEKLAGWEYPMIAVTCYQDVNGDGIVDTNMLGPDIVYGGLDKPSATFTLGGYASIWTQRGGGPAVCRADLDAYGWKAGVESIRVLAATPNFLTQ